MIEPTYTWGSTLDQARNRLEASGYESACQHKDDLRRGTDAARKYTVTKTVNGKPKKEIILP